MRRKTFEDAVCPVARSLDVVGDWWSLLIIRDAIRGLCRFGDFERSLGIAKNVLSSRLKHLANHGILESVPASDGTMYREFALTAKGRALLPVIMALGQWGEDWLFEPGEAMTITQDARDGMPLQRIHVLSHDGRRLGPTDISVVIPDDDAVELGLESARPGS